MNFLGLDWVGVTPENGRKLLLSLVFVAVVLLASRALCALVGLVLRRTDATGIQTRFWTRQAVSLVTAVVRNPQTVTRCILHQNSTVSVLSSGPSGLRMMQKQANGHRQIVCGSAWRLCRDRAGIERTRLVR